MVSNLAHNLDEEELTPEEIEDKLIYDFAYYAPRCLKIQTMEGQLVPFDLNKPQDLLEEIIKDLRSKGLLIRLLILKARREGVSTWTSGRFYRNTSTRFNRYAVQVTHEPDATDFLFKMIKRFHVKCPEEWRPATKYSNMKLLEFNTPDGKAGLDSAIRVGTAEKDDFGSGQLIHYLHLSEMAKWPKNSQKALLTSLLQCVPDEPDTEVIGESTAKGIGGEFYDRFFAARYRYEAILQDGRPILRITINEDADPQNNYCSVFLPWFVFPKYQKTPPPGFKRYKKEKGSQDPRACEEELATLYGLTDAHLYWRRDAIANKCGGSEDTFKQEYPSNPQEAFLSSGRPVFNNQQVLALAKAAPKPIQRYECLLSSGQWTANPEGRLRVWEEPVPGRSYIVSADVAEGLEHGDFSCADVIDHMTGKQVAQWHGHIDADEFGRLLVWLGKRYNMAWVAPERNNHGLTTVTAITRMEYPHIYLEMVNEPPAKPRKRFGWLTSSVSKPLIIDNLVKEMREGTHGVNCRETLMEMIGFKHQADGSMAAEQNQFDDRVVSLAIGKHLRITLPPISSNITGFGDGGIKRDNIINSQGPPPVAAWT